MRAKAETATGFSFQLRRNPQVFSAIASYFAANKQDCLLAGQQEAKQHDLLSTEALWGRQSLRVDVKHVRP
jgi:hypothetical protein